MNALIPEASDSSANELSCTTRKLAFQIPDVTHCIGMAFLHPISRKLYDFGAYSILWILLWGLICILKFSHKLGSVQKLLPFWDLNNSGAEELEMLMEFDRVLQAGSRNVLSALGSNRPVFGCGQHQYYCSPAISKRIHYCDARLRSDGCHGH
ncbi:hypothetical protein LINPERHAP2_LOCUS41518 [Linum perenne]